MRRAARRRPSAAGSSPHRSTPCRPRRHRHRRRSATRRRRPVPAGTARPPHRPRLPARWPTRPAPWTRWSPTRLPPAATWRRRSPGPAPAWRRARPVPGPTTTHDGATSETTAITATTAASPRRAGGRTSNAAPAPASVSAVHGMDAVDAPQDASPRTAGMLHPRRTPAATPRAVETTTRRMTPGPRRPIIATSWATAGSCAMSAARQPVPPTPARGRPGRASRRAASTSVGLAPSSDETSRWGTGRIDEASAAEQRTASSPTRAATSAAVARRAGRRTCQPGTHPSGSRWETGRNPPFASSGSRSSSIPRRETRSWPSPASSGPRWGVRGERGGRRVTRGWPAPRRPARGPGP